jgi:hypothetical protein
VVIEGYVQTSDCKTILHLCTKLLGLSSAALLRVTPTYAGRLGIEAKAKFAQTHKEAVEKELALGD